MYIRCIQISLFSEHILPNWYNVQNSEYKKNISYFRWSRGRRIGNLITLRLNFYSAPKNTFLSTTFGPPFSRNTWDYHEVRYFNCKPTFWFQSLYLYHTRHHTRGNDPSVRFIFFIHFLTVYVSLSFILTRNSRNNTQYILNSRYCLN